MSAHELDRLAAFAEQQLDVEAMAEVERHLIHCGECRAMLADIRRSIALTTELDAVVLPDDIAAAIRARVIPPRRSRRWLSAAAVLLAMLGAGLYWQINRPWATMRATAAEPTVFEQQGRALHAELAAGHQLDYAAVDDRDAWNWLAAQHAPIAGLLPAHSPEDRGRYRVIGAAVRSLAGTRASVVAYRIDGKPVTLVLANRREIANAPPAGLLSKTVTHRRDDNGANVLTWSVGGGTYVMVSELDDHGQRACFVCHTTPKFQSTILSLRPR